MRALAILVVLATFLAPAAAALGESELAYAKEWVDYGFATADWAARQTLGGSGATPPPEQEEEKADEGDASHGHDGSHGHGDAHHAPSSAPPAEPSRADGPLPRALTGLVPIPVELPGPAPRVDLAVLARQVTDLTTVVTPDAAPRAEAPAPVEAASIEAPAAARAPASLDDASAVAIGVAAAATASAPAAAAVWDRFRRFGWLAVLYSRIAKERLLDHGTRERLLEAIRAKPGQAVSDLAETHGVPRNTVTYHLRVLEREGLVSSTRNGRNRLFFAPGSLEKREQAGAIATLRHETTLAVARAIGQTPGVDQKALCERVGLSPSLAHWHADRLVASGLVDKRREGRNVRYYPGAAFSIVSARSA